MIAPPPDTACPHCTRPVGSLNLYCPNQHHPNPDITITLTGKQWQEIVQALELAQVRHQQQLDERSLNRGGQRWANAYVTLTNEIITSIKKHFT